MSDVFVHTLYRQRIFGRIWLGAVTALCGLWMIFLPEAWVAELQRAAGLLLLSSGGLRFASLFALALPVLNAIFAVVLGARLIAGEHESGGLVLLLSQPVSRRRLFFEKILTLPVWLVAVVLPPLFLGILLRVPAARLGMAGGVLWFQGMLFALVSCLAGVATGRGRVAWAVGGLFILLSGGAFWLPANTGWVRALRAFSPLVWGVDRQPLAVEPHWGALGYCAAAVLLLAMLSGYLFERRDLE